MTIQQLYLAIGVPMLFNAIIFGLLIAYINAKVDGAKDSINARLDAFQELWRAELHRVEEVLDARLKHLEEDRH